MHRMDSNGVKTSLAKIVFDILSNPKRKFKLHGNDQKVLECVPFEGISEAKSHNLKMKAIGFDTKKKQSVIRSDYSFIADPLFGQKLQRADSFAAVNFA